MGVFTLVSKNIVYNFEYFLVQYIRAVKVLKDAEYYLEEFSFNDRIVDVPRESREHRRGFLQELNDSLEKRPKSRVLFFHQGLINLVLLLLHLLVDELFDDDVDKLEQI